MQRQVPSIGRILVMAIFVLSCFGLLLFLWTAFGGPIPLKPHGYRFKASFDEATQLARESEVRISGVTVGKVKSIGQQGGRTEAVIEVESRYAPIPRDSRAMLRQKTLLGETYVDLTPGSADAATVPENGTLPTAQVSPTVELDEITRAFDAKTRRAFQIWLQQQGRGVYVRGQDLNDAFGYLAPFAEDTTNLLGVLDAQSTEVRQLVRNGGEVFGSLAERDGELQSLISNLDATFSATARRNRELADAVDVLPTFLDESKATLVRLRRFARDTDPLVRELRPVARELSPTLIETRKLAPDLKGFLENLGPLIDASKRGLPALEDVLNNLRPLLAQLYPFLRTLNPVIEWLGQYKHEITSFLGNVVSNTQATDISPGRTRPTHLVRALPPVNAESLAAAATNRLPTNRPNPYMQPLGMNKLGNPGLDVFENRQCTGAPLPTLDPSAVTDPPELNELVRTYVLSLGPVAPPCNLQTNFTFQGQNLHYPHVQAN